MLGLLELQAKVPNEGRGDLVELEVGKVLAWAGVVAETVLRIS